MAARIYAEGNFVVYDLDDTDGITIDFSKGAGSFIEASGVFWLQQNDEHLQERVAVADPSTFYNASTGTTPYTPDSFRTFLRENFSAGAGGSAPLGEANQVQTETERVYNLASGGSLKFQNEAADTDIFELDEATGNARFGKSSAQVYFSASGTGSYILNDAGGSRPILHNFGISNCLLWNPFNANNNNVNSIGSAFIGSGTTGNGNRKLSYYLPTSEPSSAIANTVQSFAKTVGGTTALWHLNSSGDKYGIYPISGWGDPTGTKTRTTFDPSTVTLSELGERVAAIIDDLRNQYQVFKA